MIRTDVTSAPILAALEQVAAELEDMTDLMADIGEQMLHQTDQNFLTGTAPDGTAWAPRSQTTLDAYAARGESGIGTLRLTDTMRQTISYEPGSNYVDWGSNAIQAAVMQFGAPQGSLGTASNGSPVPWGDIPARPYVGIGPDDETAILETIEEWLQRLIDS